MLRAKRPCFSSKRRFPSGGKSARRGLNPFLHKSKNPDDERGIPLTWTSRRDGGERALRRLRRARAGSTAPMTLLVPQTLLRVSAAKATFKDLAS